MNNDEGETRENSQPEVRTVKISDLKPGPIQHESLPPELLAKISKLYAFLGPYLSTTLEQFELGFMRDMHPENEIAIWSAIAFAFQNYVVKFGDGKPPSKEDGTNLVSAIILISMGVTAAQQLKLPEETASRLVACYQELFKKHQ